ncbi:MAG: cytochrome c biogenesis protein CcsA [Bacteroidales bacterium]|nr:cytochrome c biogenesis protein CcsA [Bacteroidales bacterium]
MKTNIHRISLIVWIITILTLIVSTLVKTPFYDKWWFVTLLFIFAASLVFSIIKEKTWKNPAVFGTHIAIVLILLGGFLTYTTSQNFSMHFVENEPVKGDLPFFVKLHKFDIVYYPGTMSHADYVSYVTLTDDDGNILKEDMISMNNILKYKGFRFFNEDFDEDLKGCTLTVQHDPWGIAVTYWGYLLLAISMLVIFIKNIVGKQVPQYAKTIAILLIMMMIAPVANANELKTLPKDVAAEIGDLYIYYGGRISPMQTFAKDFTVKLYGSTTYQGFTPEQVLAGWMFYPTYWKGTERQVSKRDEVKHLVESFQTGALTKIYPCQQPDGTVKWLSPNDNLPEKLSDDEWLFIRKSMGYLNELVVKQDFATLSETLAKIKAYQRKNGIAADGTTSLPSDFRFKTEKIYNVWAKYNYVAYLSLFFGIVFFVIFCVFTAIGKQMSKFIVHASLSINWIIFVFLTFLIILRWIVAGYIPLTKSAETQHFMAWVSLLMAGVMVSRKKTDSVNVVATGLIVCGLMMLVAVMSSKNPKITPLMPVLSSPLLGMHVAVIMIAYALLAFMLINGLAAMIIRIFNKDSMPAVTRMADISHAMHYPAVMCLALGIMIGAVWANISWGTYWAWDPKETWSLITLMVYAIALNKNMTPCLQKPLNFHIFNILAFLTVLMTYFGVNLLGGMHAYGS